MDTFLQFLNQNFGYPNGNLWSNIIASVLLGILGFLWGRAFEKRSMDRHNEILASHKSLTNKIDKLKK